MNNSANVDENNEHALGHSVDLLHFLQSCKDWLSGLLVISIDPSLIPGDDPQHEGWVILGSLWHGAPSEHELCSNAVHIQTRL